MQTFANASRGEHASSPSFYTPATDRDRAIGRLHEIAGDPTKPAVYAEEEEARAYLKQIIREDPELRARLKYWKQFVDAPNGKERLYKEVVLPKLFEQLRFRRTAYHNLDYPHHPFSWDPNKSSQYSLSPWFKGFFWQYSNPTQLWNMYYDNYVVHAVVAIGMFYWTKGWYIRHFGTNRAIAMIKNAKNSRRYFGKSVPVIPFPAVYVRNKMILQAVTRKMLREGKAHNLHVQQGLNSMRPPSA